MVVRWWGQVIYLIYFHSPGSPGIDSSEAIEEAVTDKSETTRYPLGSVVNHFLLHQTIIGLESKVK